MALKFRRGTTAQQSGSLAYGEPYVNTDLGTLLVGGASGDIQLSNAGPTSTFAGASVSASTFVSASSLKVTGNAAIDGNLTLGGAITIGDATSDTVNVVASLSSSLIPQTTNAFDLGSADKIWRDLYISTGSIKFVEGSTVVKTLSPSTLTALESKTGSYASTGSNTFQDRQYVTGGIEVYSSIAPDYRLVNGTTGIGYHIQNGDGGNFQIHNSTNNNKILFLFHSASLAEGNQDASFYGGLYVSKSIVTSQLNAPIILASNYISASAITGAIAATNGIVSGSSQLPTLATTGSNTFKGNQTIIGSGAGFAAYISTSVNDATLGLDTTANVNAMYFLKANEKNFEVSFDTTNANGIFRLLPYDNNSFIQIGNPSNSGNNNTDYVFVAESTYGNVLLGPGIGNATSYLGGSTP